MENNWKNELSLRLQNQLDLKSMSDFLKSVKESGVTQNEVREYLNVTRAISKEEVEDRILEILDIVEDYCNSIYKVW